MRKQNDLVPTSATTSEVSSRDTELPSKRSLPSLDEFEKALGPALTEIHEVLKPIFSIRAYELVKRKIAMEDLRAKFQQDPDKIRPSIKRHQQILTPIRKAIQAIDAAAVKAKAEDPELLANLDVLEAQRLLKMAAADLAWVKDDMLPAMIHPKLRKGRELRTTFQLAPFSEDLMPGFGCAEIEHWFIHEMDRLFAISLTTSLTEVKIGRDKIIQRIFEIAFSRWHQADQIKTARLRKKRTLNLP